jgi:hypothetical protein
MEFAATHSRSYVFMERELGAVAKERLFLNRP